MSVQQLIPHLGECRRRLSDLRGRHDYVGLTCAMLRLEGAGGTILYERPFSRILHDRPFHDYRSVSHGESFGVAFYTVAVGAQAEQIPAMLAPVEAITGEIYPLLRELPRPVGERLKLPASNNWWRVVFHLGWHFPGPFLRPTRWRLLAKDGAPYGRIDETFVQLHGTCGRSDLLPGLIYSDLEHDLCTSSEAAIGVVINTLERQAQKEMLGPKEAQIVSTDERRAFDRIRAEFLAGTRMPGQPLEYKLLKLADSFGTPPARDWASLEVGGCAERFLTLSRLNDMQEIAQIRGPATEWFCEVAERAGNTLPAWFPDHPILFDDVQRGFGGPRPVMNRGPLERWVGFVLDTLKRNGHEAMHIWWGTQMGPLSYGFAALDRDLCNASVLAIDLARLTTAAEEAASRERASCSPFSVPSLEEQGFPSGEQAPSSASPPENYTLGQLVDDLRRFGEQYYQWAEHIRTENPFVQQHSRIQIGAFVSRARAFLQGVPGFNELRTLALSLWREEICFAVGRRIVDAIVQRSNGSLSADTAEGLTLTEAVSRLTPALDGDEFPATKVAAAPPTKKPKRSTEQDRTLPSPNVAESTSPHPIVSVDNWSDLGIGIDGELRIFAFVPCPQKGECVAISKAIPIELRGDRWRKVLELLAQSEDGRTARIADLVTALGYIKKTEISISDDQAEFDEGLRLKAKGAKETLRNTMADLGRELRDEVTTATGQSTVFSAVSDDIYQAAFISGCLIRDENRKTRFLWGPSAG
jgi:hypothetical protein